MCARDSVLLFSPPAGRQQTVAGAPFNWIHSDQVKIPKQLAVLKSVIKYENVAELFLLGQFAGVVTIGGDNHTHARSASSDEEWFIAGLLPFSDRPLAATDDAHAGRRSFVAARQNNGL